MEEHGALRNLVYKCLLAAVSGLCCWVILVVGRDTGESTVLDFLRPILLSVVFAGGVLFPYLKRDRFIWFRGLGLIILSWISFMTAIIVAIWVNSLRSNWESPSNDSVALILASLFGALIVLTGARFIIPLHHTSVLVVAGIIAGTVGGLAFVLPGTDSTLVLAFMAWHTLMAAAIFVAANWPTPKDTNQNRPLAKSDHSADLS